MTIAFTGHRPNKLGGYHIPNSTHLWVCEQIDQKLVELQPTKIISGMALGVDQWAAWIAVELGIPFVAAIPFVGQEYAWPDESRKEYARLLALASETVVVSEGHYHPKKMQVRNEWMVDNCDVLIAVWDGSQGGTGNCVRYAEKRGVKIVRIDPKKKSLTKNKLSLSLNSYEIHHRSFES